MRHDSFTNSHPTVRAYDIGAYDIGILGLALKNKNKNVGFST